MRLNGKNILLPALLAVFLGATAPTALAHDHGHSHDEAVPQKLSLKNGHKWETDDSLRQAMNHIRTEMAASQHVIHEGKMSLLQYQGLAKKINDQIAFVVQNCKMDKDADAMLHLVLADIIAGADALAEPEVSKARQGAERISHALKNYGAFFEHPGWH